MRTLCLSGSQSLQENFDARAGMCRQNGTRWVPQERLGAGVVTCQLLHLSLRVVPPGGSHSAAEGPQAKRGSGWGWKQGGLRDNAKAQGHAVGAGGHRRPLLQWKYLPHSVRASDVFSHHPVLPLTLDVISAFTQKFTRFPGNGTRSGLLSCLVRRLLFFQGQPIDAQKSNIESE